MAALYRLKFSRIGTIAVSMAAIDGMSAALAGISQGQARFADAATRLSAEPSVEAIVDLKLAKTQVAASAKAARAIDDMLGQLIDDVA